MRSCYLALLLGLGLLSTGCASVVISPGEIPVGSIGIPVKNQSIADPPLVNPRPDHNRIDRGDVLEVTIATGVGDSGMLTFPVRVGNDGYADVLLVGEVELAGMLPEQAERAILAAGIRADIFKRANVVVLMEEQRLNSITVYGAVNKPGVYELSRGNSHLTSLIAMAEGTSKKSSGMVVIRRPARTNPRRRRRPGDPQFDPQRESQPVSYRGSPGERRDEDPMIERPAAIIRIDLSDPSSYDHRGLYLEDGDVVKVMPRDSQPVYVMGLVREAGQFELEPNKNMRMLDAIALAKGRTSQMADKVHIIRHVPGRAQPLVIEISVREAKLHGRGNLLLMPGDIVSVEQTPVTMVLDTIKTFVRFTLGSSVALF
ncbi:MAG: SLBB domain-containing protein [Planctomycetes bacterium]|nr:SLBB domain-containing protein [Planctomycetota bacterium]